MLLFPIPFQARHSYLPESLCLMCSINSTSRFESVFLVFALFHATLGNGLPVKLHKSLTLWPSVTALGHCLDVILGGTTSKIEEKSKEDFISFSYWPFGQRGKWLKSGNRIVEPITSKGLVARRNVWPRPSYLDWSRQEEREWEIRNKQTEFDCEFW